MPKHRFLQGSRCYLSGPMDFVASRELERRAGWRVRVGEFLESHGVTVFDPWKKPGVRGLHEYGREDLKTIEQREQWSFAGDVEGARSRSSLAEHFWETMHIDLRMVDLCDFVVAYCPTNVYSVGTVHEIVLARQQQKPVLLVSPPVPHKAWQRLEDATSSDPVLRRLVAEAAQELPVRANPRGIPSLWYMSLIGSESFFDGFGFKDKSVHRHFGHWAKDETPLDHRELANVPTRPLLPWLKNLAAGRTVPNRWSHERQEHCPDDDWLLLEQALK